MRMQSRVESRRPMALALVVLSVVPVSIGASADPPRPAQTTIDCGSEIPGLAEVLKQTRFLVFGELHGTEEIPFFFGQAVCQSASSGDQIRVALEIPVTEQPRIDAYLRS